MQLHFTGRNVEVTPALKTFTTEKFQRLEHRHANLGNINVTFQLEHLMNIAEASLHVDGIEINASGKSEEDMYSAVDELIDKLMTQITKHKEKITSKR